MYNNNDILTWDYKDNNKYNEGNDVIMNQIVLGETSKYFRLKCLSLDLNKDSLNCSLNAMFSFKSIKKLLKLTLWPSNNIWSKITDFLDVLANLPVKGVIPVSLETLTKNDFEFDHNK